MKFCEIYYEMYHEINNNVCKNFLFFYFYKFCEIYYKINKKCEHDCYFFRGLASKCPHPGIIF